MSLRTHDFLLLVRDALPGLLPPPLADFHSRIVFSSLQVYYWKPSIHYEVWPQRRTSRLEVGLHFEGPQEESYLWAAALAARALEVQAALGAAVELEAWTPSWCRLHETLAYSELDEALSQAAAGRLATLIATLQPLLEEERPRLPLGEAATGAERPGRRRTPPAARHLTSPRSR